MSSFFFLFFFTAVRQMLISQVLPNSKKDYRFAHAIRLSPLSVKNVLTSIQTNISLTSHHIFF